MFRTRLKNILKCDSCADSEFLSPHCFTADQLEETQPCNKEGDWEAELDLKRVCARPSILPRSDEGQRRYGDHGYYSHYHYKDTKSWNPVALRHWDTVLSSSKTIEHKPRPTLKKPTSFTNQLRWVLVNKRRQLFNNGPWALMGGWISILIDQKMHSPCETSVVMRWHSEWKASECTEQGQFYKQKKKTITIKLQFSRITSYNICHSVCWLLVDFSP